ncbi:MAG TPA: hypothetical protein VKA00_00470, partial [Trueperaceae bacterium]|nr:hypothetical protein [Trueperaceae bacterium]
TLSPSSTRSATSCMSSATARLTEQTWRGSKLALRMRTRALLTLSRGVPVEGAGDASDGADGSGPAS